jgi:hypothetical protein
MAFFETICKTVLPGRSPGKFALPSKCGDFGSVIEVAMDGGRYLGVVGRRQYSPRFGGTVYLSPEKAGFQLEACLLSALTETFIPLPECQGLNDLPNLVPLSRSKLDPRQELLLLQVP